MTASVKRKAAPVDLSAPAVTALEAALADKPLSLMIVAEYRDGDRVRVFSVPESPALQRGLHLMSERLIWPELKDDEGEDE
jgi:hypothetical protein